MVLVLLSASCAASPGWHFEHRVTVDPALTHNSKIVGQLVTCEVNDTTEAVRWCR